MIMVLLTVLVAQLASEAIKERGRELEIYSKSMSFVGVRECVVEMARCNAWLSLFPWVCAAADAPRYHVCHMQRRTRYSGFKSVSIAMLNFV